LVEIVERGHDVVAVYTRAPKAGGRRGLDLVPSAVEREARRFGLPVHTPATLRSAEAESAMRAHGADLAVVVAYGLILPKPILDAFPLGAFNLHASLLPRWRGAAPINRAIMAGDAETGVMVMKMEEGLDTGPIAMTERVPIDPDATAGDLHNRLAPLGADLMVRALGALERGLSPFPGAWCEIAGERERARIKLLRTTKGEGRGVPGTVLDDKLTVACADGAVRILELQRADRQAMKADEFLRGTRIAAGTRLG
jgi:methionyl-tRNA formyltransferase